MKINNETITEEIYYKIFEDTDCVYFVHDLSENMVKIGFSSNLKGRMSDILNGPGVCSDRKLLRVVVGSRTMEKNLHKQFQDIRWNKNREWFHCTDELAEFIGDIRIDSINLKTKKLTKKSDYLAQYLEEKGLVVKGIIQAYRETRPVFHKAFREWQINEGLLPYTPHRIKKEMLLKGYQSIRTNGTRYYIKDK